MDLSSNESARDIGTLYPLYRSQFCGFMLGARSKQGAWFSTANATRHIDWSWHVAFSIAAILSRKQAMALINLEDHARVDSGYK